MTLFYIAMFTLALGLFAGVCIGFKVARELNPKPSLFSPRCTDAPFPHPTGSQALQPGDKVTPSWGQPPKVSGLLLHMPQLGNTYVVRNTQISPNGTTTIQLIGVTEIRGEDEIEPYWDSAFFKLIPQRKTLRKPRE